MNPKIKAIVDKAIEDYEEYTSDLEMESEVTVSDTNGYVIDMLYQVASDIESLD